MKRTKFSVGDRVRVARLRGVGAGIAELGDKGTVESVDYVYSLVRLDRTGKLWTFYSTDLDALPAEEPVGNTPMVDPGPGYRLVATQELQAGDQATYDGVHWIPFTDITETLRHLHVKAYRRKLPVDTDTPATPKLSGATFSGTVEPQAYGEEYDIPRPFTRNKYTRDLKALDGRVVPVDPYVVSGAFNLADVIHNGEALDATIHARKKLLAPGQRGAKGVLQDLKEAHASLGRAISALEQEAP